MQFKVNFVTYRGLYRSVMSDKLNMPTVEGRRTILSNHMPVMIPLSVGVVETSTDGIASHWAIAEGMMHFENNEATILTDNVVNVEEIDLEKAMEDKNKAERKLRHAEKEADIHYAKVAISRAANLIDASDRYGKK